MDILLEEEDETADVHVKFVFHGWFCEFQMLTFAASLAA